MGGHLYTDTYMDSCWLLHFEKRNEAFYASVIKMDQGMLLALLVTIDEIDGLASDPLNIFPCQFVIH